MLSRIMTQMTINMSSVKTVDDLSDRSTVDLVTIASSHGNAEVLTALATHNNALVRAAVAGNPNITQQIRDSLANDLEGAVRTALSHNTAISAGAVADEIDEVRSDILKTT